MYLEGSWLQRHQSEAGSDERSRSTAQSPGSVPGSQSHPTPFRWTNLGEVPVQEAAVLWRVQSLTCLYSPLQEKRFWGDNHTWREGALRQSQLNRNRGLSKPCLNPTPTSEFIVGAIKFPSFKKRRIKSRIAEGKGRRRRFSYIKNEA